MNHSRKLLKRVIAITTAASFVTVGGNTALAAGSYREAETAAYDNFVAGTASLWNDYLENYQKALTGSKAVIDLKLEDTGKLLLGSAAGGMDLSWLNNVSLDTSVSIQKGLEAVKMAVLLNDSRLCDLNAYVDLGNLMEYMQVPDISGGYLQISMQNLDNGLSADSLKESMNLLSDLSTLLPDKDTVSSLLGRYGHLIIDNMEDGLSTQENVSAEGVSEDCTMYEGQIKAANAVEMVRQIAETARDDKEIKSLFDSAAEAGISKEEQYKEFQDALDELLSEVETADESADNSTAIYSKIWVNGEDKVVGREFGTAEGTEETPIFVWKAPSTGSSSGLLIGLVSDGSTVALTGSGTTENGLLTGDYTLTVDGTDSLAVHVEKLETKPEKAGYYNGKFTLTIPTNGSEDEEANMLSSFVAEINLTSDPTAGTSRMDLSLTISGISLATLSIRGGYTAEVEVPDLDTVTPVYSVEDEDNLREYLKTVNWDSLAANAVVAGVPEDLVSQFKLTLESAVENTLNPQPADTETAETMEEVS